jgi:hypothetical protein
VKRGRRWIGGILWDEGESPKLPKRKKRKLTTRQTYEIYLDECGVVLARLGAYVDKGLEIYEAEVLSKLSPKAQNVGRDLFHAIVRATHTVANIKAKRD